MVFRRQDSIGGRRALIRLGIIQGIVKAAALLAGQGGADDEVGGDHQVAELDEIAGDPKVAVVFGDFLLQQVDAVFGPFQAFGAAHDAHVIPHEAPQLVPVMGDHHFLVGIRDPALVPLAKGRGGGEGLHGFPDMVGGGFGEDEAFQQGIAGHAVGAMETGGGHFPDGMEAMEIGAPPAVGDNATTGVMGRGDHGDRGSGNVVPEFLAALMDGGEVFPDEFRGSCGHVQIDAIGPDPLHFMVHGPRHDVSRREFRARVEARHEVFAVGKGELSALAAHGFGNEKGSGLGMIETGGVKLDEFHVGDPTTGPPGHGDAVSGGDIGIAGVKVCLAGAAGGQDYRPSAERIDVSRLTIEDVCPVTPVGI